MSVARLNQEAVAARFNVSRETMSKLHAYVSLLLKWQSKINLIGPSTAVQVWDRHIADSLQLTSLIAKTASEEPVTLLDLGTGGGLPGIPLALNMAQTRRVFVHLVDSNAKKAAFLREAVRVTGLDAQVHCVRIEDLERSQIVPAPNFVVSRALASLEHLIQWAAPWVEHDAVGLFLKGRNVDKEATTADPPRGVVYKIIPAELNPESSIVVLTRRGQGQH